MEMTASEIIDLLGGPTAVARMLGIKPPSVSGWLTDGIPDGRLRDLAGQIEIKSKGRFSRREHWPDKYAFYWPELAQPTTPTPAPKPAPIVHTSDDRDSMQPVLVLGHAEGRVV